jgi:hypothetical protein
MTTDREEDQAPITLLLLLERVAALDTESVSLREILDALGARSFGPLILAAGLITLAPFVGDIPGVPTLVGFVVALTAVQSLAGRKRIWLPTWILDRSISPKKLRKATRFLQKPAAFLDRGLRPRMSGLVRGTGTHIVAVASLAVAVAMPPMEMIPFSANLAGIALTAFGLAMIVRDGLVALFAVIVSFGVLGLVIGTLL